MNYKALFSLSLSLSLSIYIYIYLVLDRQIFRGQTVDVSDKALVLQFTGDPGKTMAIQNTMAKFGIIECGRTGRIALTRGIIEHTRKRLLKANYDTSTGVSNEVRFLAKICCMRVSVCVCVCACVWLMTSCLSYDRQISTRSDLGVYVFPLHQLDGPNAMYKVDDLDVDEDMEDTDLETEEKPTSSNGEAIAVETSTGGDVYSTRCNSLNTYTRFGSKFCCGCCW